MYCNTIPSHQSPNDIIKNNYIQLQYISVIYTINYSKNKKKEITAQNHNPN